MLVVGLLLTFILTVVMDSTGQEFVPLIPSARARYYPVGRVWNNNRFIQVLE